jgi:hypothetical protein
MKSSSSSSSSRPSSSASTSTSSSSDNNHLERLNNASKNAINIVNRFANIEPPPPSAAAATATATDDTTNDNDSNPWRNPQIIENELNIVRNELNDAWMELKKKNNNNKSSSLEKNDNNENNDEISENEFHVLYMDMITDSFGDILDEMNKKQDEEGNANFDVDILVDCLQSGVDFLDPSTEYNKKSYFNSLLPLDNNDKDAMDEEKDENNNDEHLTTHQMKQRSLGYIS